MVPGSQSKINILSSNGVDGVLPLLTFVCITFELSKYLALILAKFNDCEYVTSIAGK